MFVYWTHYVYYILYAIALGLMSKTSIFPQNNIYVGFSISSNLIILFPFKF